MDRLGPMVEAPPKLIASACPTLHSRDRSWPFHSPTVTRRRSLVDCHSSTVASRLAQIAVQRFSSLLPRPGSPTSIRWVDGQALKCQHIACRVPAVPGGLRGFICRLGKALRVMTLS